MQKPHSAGNRTLGDSVEEMTPTIERGRLWSRSVCVRKHTPFRGTGRVSGGPELGGGITPRG